VCVYSVYIYIYCVCVCLMSLMVSPATRDDWWGWMAEVVWWCGAAGSIRLYIVCEYNIYIVCVCLMSLMVSPATRDDWWGWMTEVVWWCGGVEQLELLSCMCVYSVCVLCVRVCWAYTGVQVSV